MARVVRLGVYALAGLVTVKLASALSGFAVLSDAVGPGMATAAESATDGLSVSNLPLPGTAAVMALPELLAAVAAERDALAARKAALDLHEAEIDLARAAVRKQNEELSRLREDVTRLLELAKGGETADVSRLVKIYEAMKPAEAATILQAADLELAVLVIAAMAERNAGPIMAAMAPDRANAVSRILLERSRLPGDQAPVVVKLN
jgi:flagellar motility protein MotE (MotC chaperone)